MKIFAHIMGLLFGSAGAHTFPKSGQVAPPPFTPQMSTILRHRINQKGEKT